MKVLGFYFYKDLAGVAEVSDYPGGFVVVKHDFGRLHLFACEAREEIIRCGVTMMTNDVNNDDKC